MSNTEQKQKILLKRTTEVDRPSIPSGASHGELFLNIASGANAHNKISTMQIGTNNPIIWSDDVANEKKFASKTEVEALVKEVEDNELVTATAISTMNASAGFNEDGSSVLEGGVSLSQAIIDLQARAGVIEESDPIFAKSAASGITSADITNWNNKMDAVDRISSAYTSYSADTSVSAKTSVSATTAVSAKTSVNAVSASTSISASTSVSAKTSVSATTSTKAIQDDDGNVITTTYSTKAELSGAVNDIIEEIIDNELVTSTAISTMNASAGFNEDGSSVLEGGVSLSEAIIELQKNDIFTYQLPEFPYGENIALTDEDIEHFKNSKTVYFKVTLPSGDTIVDIFLVGEIYAISEDYLVYDSITKPEYYGEDTNFHDNRWNFGYYQFTISLANKTISYLPYGFDCGELSEKSYSATTAVSASTSDKAYKDGDGNVISSTYASKDELENYVPSYKTSFVDVDGEWSPEESDITITSEFVWPGASSDVWSQSTIYLGGDENGRLIELTASDENADGIAYSQNLTISALDGVKVNGSDVITKNNASANGVLVVDANGIANKDEITIGTFEIKNDKPYSYTLEGEFYPYDPNAVSGFKVTAQYDGEGVKYGHVIDSDNVFGEYSENWYYDFIITDISFEGLDLDDESDGDEMKEHTLEVFLNTRIPILAAYIDNEYTVNGINTVSFTDDVSEEIDILYTSDNYIKNAIVTRSAPYSLKHTSKALLNGAPVATIDMISDAVKVDSTLSTTSVNPVQNKVITNKIDELIGTLGGYVKSYVSDDMGDFYNEISSNADEDGAHFTINSYDGSYTKTLSLNEKGINLEVIDTGHDNVLTINEGGLMFNISDSMYGDGTFEIKGDVEGDAIYCAINGEKIATENYVKEIASGGIKFKGIVSVLPWEGEYDEAEFSGTDFEVGDLIIVAPNGDTTTDPSREYILTKADHGNEDSYYPFYHWELLGETTVVDKRITDEITRAKAAEDDIRKHKHGKIILSGDASGEVVIQSGITNNVLNVTVKDDSHQHTRFANMVHFDNDIHLCNNGGNMGGTIYFGDDVDGDDGTRYTYITEESDDRLDFVSRNGFAFRHYDGYEALVSIKKSNEAEEIHMAFNKTLSDDELYASSEIIWYSDGETDENIEIKSNQIRLNTSIINLNGNSTFKSHGDIKFNVNRLLCNNKEVAVKNDIYNVINFRGVIDEYPWEYESINNNYNIRDVIAYTPVIEDGEGSGGSEDVLEKRDYELYIKIDNNIWAPLGGAGKNEGVEGLLDLIEENEFVTSNALNRITASAGFDVNGESTLPNRQSLTEAIVELQNAVGTGPNAGGGSSLSLVANTGSGKYYLLGQADTSSNAQGVYKNAKVYMNNGRLYSESDKTLKTHIDHVNGDPELIKQIPKVYYHWKDDETKETQMGTYAQDLEKVYPELVATGEDGIKAVAYDKLGVVALAGIDKLYEIVQQLQAKNEELEKRIKELENK